jgi:GNAT superfamily N-acetyltransferase
VRNRRQKKDLVERGRSHGILVYSRGEPVGWCQYGSWEELPRFESHLNRLRSAPDDEAKKRWRITCFVVARKYRRRGVATAALRAALEAIKEKGGGLVEAYPIRSWGAYREYLGTVSMFKNEGFQVVVPYGKSNVVVQRTI